MISVQAERVRKKARLDDSYDEDIKEIIKETMPYITSKIKEEYLETKDENIESIINLGTTEIITGEFIKEQANDEDDSVGMGIGPIKFTETGSVKSRSQRAKDYIKSGWEKLEPYVKSTDDFYFGVMGYE